MLRVYLLGKFRLTFGGREVEAFSSAKAQELFSYLLLNRDRSSSRERVASVLWGDHLTTSQSKKYLRHTVWQVHSLLRGLPETACECLLQVDANWISIPSGSPLWLDVSVVEAAYDAVRGKPGMELDDAEFEALERAVELYAGDLLEGWYQDWCLYERERLLQIYLMMLDKLMASCEARQKYEAGLSYGMNILKHDRARECTHRQMMRLYAKSGDRTRALRQYHECKSVLEDELDVAPSDRTERLYRQVESSGLSSASAEEPDPLFGKILSDLRQLQSHVLELRRHVTSSRHPTDPPVTGNGSPD